MRTRNKVPESLEDSAKHINVLVFTFASLCAYLWVTGVSTTDESLLLGKTYVLPVLEITVPMTGFTGFFVLSLPVLALFHLYLLHEERQFLREVSRRRAPVTNSEARFFAAVLASLSQGRPSLFALMVLQVMFVSVNLLLPMITLLTLQTKFLPYHSPRVTSGHQIVITADLLALGVFIWKMPLFQRHATLRGYLAAFGVLSLVYAWLVAVMPGDETPMFRPLADKLTRNLSLVEKDLVAERPPSDLMAVLLQQGRSEDEIVRRFTKGIRLVDRDLRNAVFTGSLMVNADFRGADLRGAVFVDADLRGARFMPSGATDGRFTLPPGDRKRTLIAKSRDREAEHRPTRLEGADLTNARLSDANLILARLYGARLRNTDLQRAELSFADLTKANLRNADLQMAELSHCRLEQADLTNAKLLGANLAFVRAGGADFLRAELQAANLLNADLAGARLVEGMFQGVDFRGAVAIGADFRYAGLQGAVGLVMEGADLRGAKIGGLTLCQEVPAPPYLTDLRGVDFRLEDASYWSSLRDRLRETPERPLREAAEGRLSLAGSRRTCLAGKKPPDPIALHPIERRRLLYYQDQLSEEPMGDWPVPELDERGYFEELADFLVERSCEIPGLALSLAREVTGTYVPRDLAFEKVLAEHLREQLAAADVKDDPLPCKGLQELPQDLRDGIAALASGDPPGSPP